MPDYGHLTEERLPATSPAVAPLYPSAPWPLPGATVLKILYETDPEPVLTWLPPKLSRSSPPYAVLTVARYPESPVGPFTLATQAIGCRAAFFIRAFTLQAVTDNSAALAALRELWGYPCKLGAIDLTAAGDSASASIKVGLDTIAEITLSGGAPIDGSSVRFDPVLNLRLAPSLEEGRRHDIVQMVQIDPDCEGRDAIRGRGEVRFPSTSEVAPWHLLSSRNVISTVSCRVDTELPLARFVMPY
jgi:acetoacetate decarboxylase